MVKKVSKEDSEDDTGTTTTAAQLASTVRESAQQIWLAGLGAFSKAQEEGGKMFEALVKEGVTIQRRSQSAAEVKLTEASSRMTSMASELSNKAAGQWDKLEGIFEQRVSRALGKLEIPSLADMDALAARIDELERTVAALSGGGAASRRSTPGSAAPRKADSRRVGAKTARKRSTARKSTE